MFKSFLFLILAVVFAAGCGVKAQTYVMTKDRTDIEPSGNAGYLGGSGSYKEPEKKTRKIYVLEVSKPVPASEVRKIEESVSKTTTEHGTVEEKSSSTSSYTVEEPETLKIPVIEDEPAFTQTSEAVVSGPTEDTPYTVLKDDTLQKIAKKFYGSYGKWIQIYEANKDKLKNPNFVKPGTVIIIPAAK